MFLSLIVLGQPLLLRLSDVPLPDILAKAGWKSDSTFAKFYDKRIIEDTFANKVLQ